MKVRGKRPSLDAKQFDGTRESAEKVIDFLSLAQSYNARYVPAHIAIDRGPFGSIVKEGDWVIRDHDGLLLAVSDEAFHQRYEPAE